MSLVSQYMKVFIWFCVEKLDSCFCVCAYMNHVLVMQNPNEVRFVNLSNIGWQDIDLENFATMPNLHFLVLDGCRVHGNLGSISKELRYLQWKHLPLSYIPPLQHLSNLISLDFSESTKLANIWIESA